MQKGFANIIGVLILALFFGGLGLAFYKGYLTLNNNSGQTTPSPSPTPSAQPSASSQPTPAPSSDETTSWKTYTDNKFGFSIKYPSNMEITQEQPADNLLGGVRLNLIYNDNAFRPQASEINVGVFNPQNKDIENYFSQVLIGSVEGYKMIGKTNLGGVEGISYEGTAMGFKVVGTAISHGGHFYKVGYVYVNEDLSSYYNQILPTFKFTEKN